MIRHRKGIVLLTLCYLCFVIYGSLVTRQIDALSFEQALEAFGSIRFLDLGPQQREDLVANLVLYLPVGFLLTLAFWPRYRNAGARLGAALAALLTGVLIAVSVEFVQVFFHRTVSLNDLIVEAVGTALGVAIWMRWHDSLASRFLHISASSSEAIRSALLLYLIGYLLVSLFPFDFLLSFQELAWKWESRGPSLLYAVCQSTMHCTIRLFIEVLMAIPVGLLLLDIFRPKDGTTIEIARILSAALAMALLIEVLQFFTVSGRFTLLSILLRVAGVVLAVVLYRKRRIIWLAVGTRLRPLALGLVFPYLVALMWVNGWFDWNFPSVSEIEAKVEFTRFIPFYYHYFTSETAALKSLLAQLLMYAPVGLIIWMLDYANVPGSKRRAGSIKAAIFSIFLAALMWTGRMLFATAAFADPTNIWIAGFAGYLTYSFCRTTENWLSAEFSGAHQSQTNAVGVRARNPLRLPPFPWLLALLLAALFLIGLMNYSYRIEAGLFFVIYAAVLWRYPEYWMLPVAVALPAFDLGYLSGQFYFDEFDLLLVLTLSILLLRIPIAQSWWSELGRARAPLLLLCAALATSLVVGLASNASVESAGYADYYDGLNLLRVLKGFLLPLLFLPFVGTSVMRSGDASRRFAIGVVLGVLLVSLVAILERLVFPGLLDFDSAYRVAANVSAMHMGGQVLDAYLIAALPLTFLLYRGREHVSGSILVLIVLAILSYVVFVTFSRWTIAVYLFLLLLMLLRTIYVFSSWRVRRYFVMIVIFVSVLLSLAVLIFTEDTYLAKRMKTVPDDAKVRLSHWGRSLELGDGGFLAKLLGQGMGRYPGVKRETLPLEERMGRVAFIDEEGSRFARLEGGSGNLYFDQFVRPGKERRLLFFIETRTRDLSAAELTVSICEKSLMYSYGCIKERLIHPGGSGWTQHTISFDQRKMVRVIQPVRRMSSGRPSFLSLAVPASGSTLDVDNLSLVDGSGRELLRNGDFSAGNDFWFLTSDDHLAVHVKNMYVLVMLESGWVGLVSLLLYLMVVFIRVFAHGDTRPEKYPFAISLVGLMLLGMTSGLLDAPRVAALLLFITFFALYRSTAQEKFKGADKTTDRLSELGL